jgi:hypothetical protein
MAVLPEMGSMRTVQEGATGQATPPGEHLSLDGANRGHVGARDVYPVGRDILRAAPVSSPSALYFKSVAHASNRAEQEMKRGRSGALGVRQLLGKPSFGDQLSIELLQEGQALGSDLPCPQGVHAGSHAAVEP